MIKELTHEFANRVIVEIEGTSTYKCKHLRPNHMSSIIITSSQITPTIPTAPINDAPEYIIVFSEGVDKFYVLINLMCLFKTNDIANPIFTPKRIAEIIIEDFEKRYPPRR